MADEVFEDFELLRKLNIQFNEHLVESGLDPQELSPMELCKMSKEFIREWIPAEKFNAWYSSEVS